jgi:3-phenylpropionate/cinnamic acid dioxygenase small subunit
MQIILRQNGFLCRADGQKQESGLIFSKLKHRVHREKTEHTESTELSKIKNQISKCKITNQNSKINKKRKHTTLCLSTFVAFY